MSAQTRLAHTDFGPPDAPALLLLHGFMGSRADWGPLAARLAPSWRCIAVDLPGHGGSPLPGTAPYADFAAAAVATLSGLGLPRCAVAGYSLGGRLALYLATHHADRFPAVAASSACPGLPDEASRAPRRRWDVTQAEALRTLSRETFLRQWYQLPVFASLQARPALLQTVMGERARGDAVALAAAMVAFSVADQPDLWPRLPALGHRLCFIAGALDTKYATFAQQIAAACPHAAVHLLDSVGHTLHLETPDTFARILASFLSTVLSDITPRPGAIP